MLGRFNVVKMPIFVLLALMGLTRGIPWTDFECCTWLPFSFDGGPLQLETMNASNAFFQLKSNVQTTSLIWRIEGNFWVKNYLSAGTNNRVESSFTKFTNKPDNATIWLLNLTSKHLVITANSYVVLDLDFVADSVECSKQWEDAVLTFEVKFPAQNRGILRFRNLPLRKLISSYLYSVSVTCFQLTSMSDCYYF